MNIRDAVGIILGMPDSPRSRGYHVRNGATRQTSLECPRNLRMQKRGINLIAADSPASFLDDTPTARLIRQVLGAVSKFEKAMIVCEAARRP